MAIRMFNKNCSNTVNDAEYFLIEHEKTTTQFKVLTDHYLLEESATSSSIYKNWQDGGDQKRTYGLSDGSKALGVEGHQTKVETIMTENLVWLTLYW